MVKCVPERSWLTTMIGSRPWGSGVDSLGMSPVYTVTSKCPSDHDFEA
jgi:hypothetical protein